MKRSSLALSVFAASLLGCLAFSGTAAAAGPAASGPSTCIIAYDYCLWVSGNTKEYCDEQLYECQRNENVAPTQGVARNDGLLDPRLATHDSVPLSI
jgi:hypothetical protein